MAPDGVLVDPISKLSREAMECGLSGIISNAYLKCPVDIHTAFMTSFTSTLPRLSSTLCFLTAPLRIEPKSRCMVTAVNALATTT